MVTHRRYLSSDDTAPSNPYLSAPISTRRKTTSGLISIKCLVYFWIYLTLFIIPFVSFHHAQPLYPCFIFSLRLCAPLVYSLPDSFSDISLFISLTDPLAFVLRWFIHSHDPLWFRFAHKSFSRSLSRLFLYPFLYGQMFPNMGEQLGRYIFSRLTSLCI